ncbi:unnamed protein product [Acanthosepion pharaonis]|uniref:Uncharacterized protein n=1 Tax=Acanthosepion pharaonis TaxID=158019 RepID=A0A812DCJ1_ACAPH|nr:unnamed protein product [Sepia pharaonis]
MSKRKVLNLARDVRRVDPVSCAHKAGDLRVSASISSVHLYSSSLSHIHSLSLSLSRPLFLSLPLFPISSHFLSHFHTLPCTSSSSFSLRRSISHPCPLYLFPSASTFFLSLAHDLSLTFSPTSTLSLPRPLFLFFSHVQSLSFSSTASLSFSLPRPLSFFLAHVLSFTFSPTSTHSLPRPLFLFLSHVQSLSLPPPLSLPHYLSPHFYFLSIKSSLSLSLSYVPLFSHVLSLLSLQIPPLSLFFSLSPTYSISHPRLFLSQVFSFFLTSTPFYYIPSLYQPFSFSHIISISLPHGLPPTASLTLSLPRSISTSSRSLSLPRPLSPTSSLSLSLLLLFLYQILYLMPYISLKSYLSLSLQSSHTLSLSVYLSIFLFFLLRILFLSRVSFASRSSLFLSRLLLSPTSSLSINPFLSPIPSLSLYDFHSLYLTFSLSLSLSLPRPLFSNPMSHVLTFFQRAISLFLSHVHFLTFFPKSSLFHSFMSSLSLPCLHPLSYILSVYHVQSLSPTTSFSLRSLILSLPCPLTYRE